MPKDTNKSNQRTLETLVHVLGIFTYFIGALVVFLSSSDKEVKRHARNALNWQISAASYMIISLVLMLIIIGFFLMIAVVILNLIFCIIATVKASEGKLWEYPLSIKFVK